MKSPYKRLRGMSDLLPAELPAWHRLEAVVRETMRAYGYGEMRTPLLESTQLFERSIGEATDVVEKEMYTFESRGGERMSLRPENTASCVRAIVDGKVLQPGTSARIWYQGPMFRYERPQKGRQRQFHQFGAEAYGLPGPIIEAELILLSKRVLEALGIHEAVQLEVNTLGTSEERQQYRERLVGYFNDHLSELDDDSVKRLERNPLRILDSKNPDMQNLIDAAPRLLDGLGEASREHYQLLLDTLAANGVDAIENPRLVRGLDYYSHTVFEWTTDKLGSQSAVCAGGRYDGLLDELGAPGVAGVGWASGIERVLALMDVVGVETAEAPVDVFVMAAGSVSQTDALKLAEELRAGDAGLAVVHNSNGGSMKSQFRKADKSGAAFAVVLGDDELASGTVSLKPLRSEGEQQQLTRANLAALIREKLH